MIAVEGGEGASVDPLAREGLRLAHTADVLVEVAVEHGDAAPHLADVGSETSRPHVAHHPSRRDVVEDPAFRFSRQVSFSGDVLTLDYVYESRRNFVPAADIRSYSDHVRAARELAYYSIQWVDPSIDFQQRAIATDDANWPAALLLAALVAAHHFDAALLVEDPAEPSLRVELVADVCILEHALPGACACSLLRGVGVDRCSQRPCGQRVQRNRHPRTAGRRR
mgnify:CR=1 FL=1